MSNFVKLCLFYLTFENIGVTIKPTKNILTAKMKDKTFITLSGIFFLLFFIGIGALTLNKPVSNILRAKNVVPSPLKSFAVVFPQIASVGDKSQGKEPSKIKISVYIRGVDGSILPSKSVKLSADPPNIIIEPSDTQLTNNIGQAQFSISSQIQGKIKLIAKELASNIEVVNIPTVEFVP
ncbi:hypothetical protein A2W14_03560 [Candidatus Gottesmanbacteria bacterium RBG_16_37_8]|uniref:Big-1 domain-containing protein n=1 Tax=Candidatus Gottesmanbacteria bacterium RBG_16_37_8 TaxID=1798371 RepID=A0A1F5YTB7_9BACT|nr:MAG: hypothetical protein A2W14_03560 [Candidatus Gottesmanbacteria bacterium RBG_16_37_8]